MRLVSIWRTTIGYISKVNDNYLFEYDNKKVHIKMIHTFENNN